MINIEDFLKKYFKDNDKIILACSTWPDSMFLLYKILKTNYKKNLVVCYFNHKTRPETDLEEKFILELWEKEWFKVEIANCDFEKIKKLYPSKSFEELAREKRYQFFDAILNIYKANYIITAHHLDDKIETFLFNMMRWSKLSWLINMTECSGSPYTLEQTSPPTPLLKGEESKYKNSPSPWGERARGWGKILRPLLNLEKSNILSYLEKNNLKYFIDQTNSDTDITRNYLRHEIVPKFEKINKSYKSNISNLLNYFEDIKENIDKEVLEFLWDNDYFIIHEFNKKSNLLQKEIIRQIYFVSNWNSTIWLSESNIAEILKFINWKNNKTIKEIKKLNMKKDWKKIFFKFD